MKTSTGWGRMSVKPCLLKQTDAYFWPPAIEQSVIISFFISIIISVILRKANPNPNPLMETENTSTRKCPRPPLRNHALRWGLSVGLTSAILSFAAVCGRLFLNGRLGRWYIVCHLYWPYHICRYWLQEGIRALPFIWQSLSAWHCFACSGDIATLFNIMLFQVIDTDLGGQPKWQENTPTMMAGGAL